MHNAPLTRWDTAFKCFIFENVSQWSFRSFHGRNLEDTVFEGGVYFSSSVLGITFCVSASVITEC